MVELKKSTGTRDRSVAMKLALALEDAAQGRMDADQAKDFLATVKDLRSRSKAHRAFNDVLRRATGRGLENRSVKGFALEWLELCRTEVAPATLSRYEQTVHGFLESLAGKAELDVGAITRQDVAGFRDSELKRVAAATANVGLKILKAMLRKAEEDGLVARNVAKFVKPGKVTGGSSGRSRRPFTLPELKQVLGVCDPEWRSLVLFGLYTGQRLGDLAALTWANVDLLTAELRLTTIKTDGRVVIPLATPLRRHLEALPAGDDPAQPIHPRAHAIWQRQGRVGTLSRQFGEILAAAGLTKPRSHHADTKRAEGEHARRETSALSFHSLRHTAVSLLKNAGVSDAIAQDLIGHESAAISRQYTHISDEAKRNAVSRLPDVQADRPEHR